MHKQRISIYWISKRRKLLTHGHNFNVLINVQIKKHAFGKFFPIKF